MPLLEECELHFDTRSLYDVLGVAKTASADDIKKGYREMSLKVHPDRASEEEKEAATAKFQVLGKAYNILSDSNRRSAYDESGYIDDEMSDEIIDWKQFWKSRFGGRDLNDLLTEYTDEYWGSETEAEDLKKAYEKHKGNMNKILNEMFCRPVEHEPKYRELILGWIDNEEVTSYRAFTHETKAKQLARKRKYQKEQKEAELFKKNAATFQQEVGDSMSSLASIIAQRNQNRMQKQEAFLDGLAAKYAKPKKTRKANRDAAGTSKKKKKT